jgi:hypothetical protein
VAGSGDDPVKKLAFRETAILGCWALDVDQTQGTPGDYG